MATSADRRLRTLPRLTPAERARTIVASASTLRVLGPDLTLDVHRHGVLPDGSILFQAPTDGFGDGARGDLGRVTATAVDVATVPQPDRVRGKVTLNGTVYDVVEPLPAGMRMHLTGSDEPGAGTRLVRLVPDRIGLSWLCETRDPEPTARRVDLDDYRRSFPDPLLGYEVEWLPHLQADHAGMLYGLARYELGWDEEPEDVRALGIDRYGLVLRVRHCGVSNDVRIAFDRAVACGCDVREAFSALIERALPGAGPVC